MKKKFDEYSLYVFDLDGTLYDQPRLRLAMAKRLIGYYCLHPFKINELFLLMAFRKKKDAWTDEAKNMSEEDGAAGTGAGNKDALNRGENISISPVDLAVVRALSKERNVPVDRLAAIVKKWIYDDPLSALYAARDEELIGVMERLREEGKKVLILSDYPAVDKLKALGILADGVYCSADEKIGALKPSPKGLMVIADDFSADKADMIMVGDRHEKDGAAAENFGCDYLILNRHINKRKGSYEGMRL